MQIDYIIEIKQERKEKITKSLWICNDKPTLINLQDNYILFEGILSETVIFYKDIITIKKDIQEIHWEAYLGGGYSVKSRLLLKTTVEDFELTTNLPSLKESDELCNDLYSQIIDKMVENK